LSSSFIKTIDTLIFFCGKYLGVYSHTAQAQKIVNTINTIIIICDFLPFFFLILLLNSSTFFFSRIIVSSEKLTPQYGQIFESKGMTLEQLEHFLSGCSQISSINNQLVCINIFAAKKSKI